MERMCASVVSHATGYIGEVNQKILLILVYYLLYGMMSTYYPNATVSMRIVRVSTARNLTTLALAMPARTVKLMISTANLITVKSHKRVALTRGFSARDD